MKTLKLVPFVLFLVALCNLASAHNLDVEEQTLNAKPWQTMEGDASFASPHHLFYLPPEDTDELLNLSWFLPTGCPAQTLHCTISGKLKGRFQQWRHPPLGGN